MHPEDQPGFAKGIARCKAELYTMIVLDFAQILVWAVAFFRPVANLNGRALHIPERRIPGREVVAGDNLCRGRHHAHRLQPHLDPVAPDCVSLLDRDGLPGIHWNILDFKMKGSQCGLFLTAAPHQRYVHAQAYLFTNGIGVNDLIGYVNRLMFITADALAVSLSLYGSNILEGNTRCIQCSACRQVSKLHPHRQAAFIQVHPV